jgi:hypothetical protein
VLGTLELQEVGEEKGEGSWAGGSPVARRKQRGRWVLAAEELPGLPPDAQAHTFRYALPTGHQAVRTDCHRLLQEAAP